MDIASLLNICFIVSLVIAILFIGITVLLFFIYDIRTIFLIRTGKAQAKAVEEMSSNSVETGRLRNHKKKTAQAQVYANKGEIPIADNSAVDFNKIQSQRSNNISNKKWEDTAESTTILETGNQETQLLPSDGGETILSDDKNGNTEFLSKNKVTSSLEEKSEIKTETNETKMSLTELNFEVVKKVVSTFTDEVIT